MYSFAELKRAAKRYKPSESSKKLAVLGDSATQFLATAIQGAAVVSGLSLEVIDTDYDQIPLQVMDPASELNTCGADYALLWLCPEKVRLRFYETPVDQRSVFAEQEVERIVSFWDGISSGCGALVLQATLPELDDGVFGSFGAKVEVSLSFQLRKLNMLLMEQMAKRGDVLSVDITTAFSAIGWEGSRSPRLWYSARLTPDTRALPLFANRVVAVVRAQLGIVTKCVVLDLDNTLWGGVIGDDGIEGIQLGELGVGRAHTDLQFWLRELRRRGIILAVCSKNDDCVAREPFESHPDMVLKMSDISAFVANWEDKATNIRHIRDLLDIGFDSMVFLDDNPFEREVVRSLVPEVIVPELPDDPAEWLTFLAGLNLFETATYSANDSSRTEQYRAEADRRVAAASYGSYGEYLADLKMVAEALPFDDFNAPRIAQLTQRSNQFNLRTKRYSEADVLRMAGDSKYATLFFNLRDRFGDHGLISVVVLEINGTEAFVDTWLMSCRVLRRGMEEFVANKIVETAVARGCDRVVGEYLPTRKNSMVADLYTRMGFQPVGDGRYLVNVQEYVAKENCILERGVENDGVD